MIEDAGEAVEIDLGALAMEWAACRRALRTVDDLTDAEQAEFAALVLVGLEETTDDSRSVRP